MFSPTLANYTHTHTFALYQRRQKQQTPESIKAALVWSLWGRDGDLEVSTEDAAGHAKQI